MFVFVNLACATCSVSVADGGGSAISWSIFFLLIVVLGVLGGIGAFIFHLARGSRQNHDPSLSDDYLPVESTN